MKVSRKINDAEFWAAEERRMDRVRASEHTLPTFGIVPLAGEVALGEWALPDGSTRELIYHQEAGTVRVITTTSLGGEQLVRDRSTRGTERAHEARPGAEPLSGRATLTPGAIDNTPEDFLSVTLNNSWWAWLDNSDHAIVVEAPHALDRIDLIRVDDLEPFLEGRLQWIRDRRQQAKA